MIVKDSTGREAEVEVCCESDACDSYFADGTYLDNGARVDDSELEWMTDAYADRIEAECFEHMVGRAEAYYEGDR